MNQPKITISLANHTLALCPLYEPCDAVAGACCEVLDMLTSAKVANILQKLKFSDMQLLCRNVAQAFEEFSAHFKYVEAAGGLVHTPQGQVLMMWRNGRWDLPKGHIEPGESPGVCALREVEEETGVAGAKIVGSLGNTLHCYNVYGAWELKRTFWYSMSIEQTVRPTPQHEEGIERVEWCAEDVARQRAAMSYPTIRCVFEEFTNRL
jgi:8-oxo-dGTP pyrophosphatase MutT (NUDIX family)